MTTSLIPIQVLTAHSFNVWELTIFSPISINKYPTEKIKIMSEFNTNLFYCKYVRCPMLQPVTKVKFGMQFFLNQNKKDSL